MSYDTLEESVASSKPIEFYDFVDDFGNHSRITSGPVDIDYIYPYYSEPCSRSELKLQEFNKKNAMTFKLSVNNAFAIQYISGPIEGKATVTCFRKQQDDPEVRQFWFGMITGVKFGKNGIPEVTAEARTSSIGRTGRRRRCLRLCDHDLYDAYCGLSKESYRVDGTISNISASGLVISSTVFGTKSDGYFAYGGELIVGNARRMIEAHTGNDVTITRKIATATVGDSLTAYGGCAHTPTACNAKSNKINYGGDEFLPKKNPYQDGILINGESALAYWLPILAARNHWG